MKNFFKDASQSFNVIEKKVGTNKTRNYLQTLVFSVVCILYSSLGHLKEVFNIKLSN